MKCIYCNNENLYKLKSGQLKCAKCKKKFSPKKIQTDSEIIECFINDLTANQSAKKLNMSYVTVKKRYELFRSLIANFLEEQYANKDVIEYDEYIYLQKSKKKIKENIFDAQNFLTFHYDDKVYNLLMPNLNRYKSSNIKEFSKFMMMNKISKTKKGENLITQFWIFFENSILKYKGINDDNFFFYLKEIEFKFNYSQQVQTKTLSNLYTNTYI